MTCDICEKPIEGGLIRHFECQKELDKFMKKLAPLLRELDKKAVEGKHMKHQTLDDILHKHYGRVELSGEDVATHVKQAINAKFESCLDEDEHLAEGEYELRPAIREAKNKLRAEARRRWYE